VNNDVGWGSDSEPTAWGAAGSAALLITAGLYWTSLWLVGGLAPLPSLASRALWRVARTRLSTSPHVAEEHAYE
jgi:hypothetical protein